MMFAGCGSVPILGPQAVSTREIAPIASRDIHTAAAAPDTRRVRKKRKGDERFTICRV